MNKKALERSHVVAALLVLILIIFFILFFIPNTWTLVNNIRAFFGLNTTLSYAEQKQLDDSKQYFNEFVQEYDSCLSLQTTKCFCSVGVPRPIKPYLLNFVYRGDTSFLTLVKQQGEIQEEILRKELKGRSTCFMRYKDDEIKNSLLDVPLTYFLKENKPYIKKETGEEYFIFELRQDNFLYKDEVGICFLTLELGIKEKIVSFDTKTGPIKIPDPDWITKLNSIPTCS